MPRRLGSADSFYGTGLDICFAACGLMGTAWRAYDCKNDDCACGDAGWQGALPVAQAPVTKANVVMISATIQAIDTTTVTLTLRDDKGTKTRTRIGPAVQRLTSSRSARR